MKIDDDLEKKMFLDEILNHDWGKVSTVEKKKLSSNSKPAFQLDKILEGKTIEQLREIAEERMIPEFKDMKIFELVYNIKNDIFEEDYFYSDLVNLSSASYAFLSYLVSVDFHEENNLPVEAYEKLVLLGFVGLYEINGKFKLTISHEVKSLFKKMQKEGMRDMRITKSILHMIANAAVNLYGFISLVEFAEIFERITGIKYIKIYMNEMLEDTQYTEDLDFYDVVDGYILHDGIDMLEDEHVEFIMKAAFDKPRYIPASEEYLMYANPVHLGLGHGLDEIIKFIKKHAGKNDIEILIGDLRMYFAMNILSEDIIRKIEEYGINLRPNDIIKLKKLFDEARNCVRLWENKGYSTNEIKILHNPNITLLSSYQK